MSTEYQREQAERIATMRQDADLRQQQQTSTLHQHAQAQADELSQGRFRATGTPIVTGATAIPAYPPGPTWCTGDQGIEPPLNYSVNELQPTGESHEIAASIAAQESLEASTSFTQGPLPSSAPDDAPSPNTPLLSPDVERRDAGLGLF
jgi:hypothetical protein